MIKNNLQKPTSQLKACDAIVCRNGKTSIKFTRISPGQTKHFFSLHALLYVVLYWDDDEKWTQKCVSFQKEECRPIC